MTFQEWWDNEGLSNRDSDAVKSLCKHVWNSALKENDVSDSSGETESRMEMLMDYPWEVFVDKKAVKDYKIKIIAGAKTYALGNKSIDHVLKRYGDAWRDQIEDSEIDKSIENMRSEREVT